MGDTAVGGGSRRPRVAGGPAIRRHQRSLLNSSTSHSAHRECGGGEHEIQCFQAAVVQIAQGIPGETLYVAPSRFCIMRVSAAPREHGSIVRERTMERVIPRALAALIM